MISAGLRGVKESGPGQKRGRQRSHQEPRYKTNKPDNPGKKFKLTYSRLSVARLFIRLLLQAVLYQATPEKILVNGHYHTV